jgi:hypothetical protein
MNWSFLKRELWQFYSQVSRLSGKPKSLPTINFNLHDSSSFAIKYHIKLLELLFAGHLHVERASTANEMAKILPATISTT